MPPNSGAERRTGHLATPPTGTVTFLFSDIEGSTERWEAHPETMSEALARHDHVLRSVIESRGGYVFKTIGDAFCASFKDPAVALVAAFEAQCALNAEDFSAVDGLRVRMALHSGSADERDGDYFGRTVNRVARLLAIGHGGQVLVSSRTAEFLCDMLPEHTALRDLGEHRLKDLTQPEHVFQLIAPDLVAEFPPLRSLTVLTNNLPQQLTRLIGRDDDVRHIRDVLANHRLVTLTGVGGIGKTRLALQIGAEELDAHPDGVWFVELAPLSNPALVASAVATALGVTASSQEQLVSALKIKRFLLIMDNCEHVIEASAIVAGALLEGCPQMRIIATSRAALRVEGEQVIRVSSLSAPDLGRRVTAEEALDFPAIALFVERATAVDEQFTLTDADAPIVASICQHLDGVALAIELAAARVSMLGVNEIAAALTDRFQLLTGGGRTVLPRHQTLHALIGWSYDLLSDHEKALFRRLTVFAGTFDLEAVRLVCVEEPVDKREVLELLSSLLDSSMVVAEQSKGKKRYRLLETMRQFAREHLESAGEFNDIARRHARYYHRVSKRVMDERETATTDAPLVALDPDLDNCRAALDWAFGSRGDVEVGADLVIQLRAYWHYRGLECEGLQALDRALDELGSDVETVTVARLLNGISSFAAATAQLHRALRAARRAEAIARRLGDSLELGIALTHKGHALSRFGFYNDADLALEEALPLVRAHGSWRRIHLCLQVLAFNERERGDFEAASQLFREMRVVDRSRGDEYREMADIAQLAETEFGAGDSRQAIALAREALSMLRDSADKYSPAAVLSNLSGYLLAAGEIADARSAGRQAIELCRASGFGTLVYPPLEKLALCAALSGAVPTAARLVGFTESIVRSLGPRDRIEKLSYDRLMTILGENLSSAELAELMAKGEAMSKDQAIEEALSV